MPKIKPIDCSKEEFVKFIKQDVPHYTQERSVKNRFPEHYGLILQCHGTTFAEKIHNYVNDIYGTPMCPICGSPVNFVNFANGYRKYCSNKCATSDPERIKKMEQTCFERYGVKNARQDANIVNKAKQTCFERYGVENPSQLDEVKEKKRSKAIKRYGVENVSQSKEVINKIATTHKARYGEATISQARAKQKNPDIIRFDGRTWICKCPHPDCNKCTEKWYETRSMLYKNRRESGTELCTRLLPLQPTISTYELRIRSWLDDWGIEYICSVRDVIDGELDIYIPSKKIAIEFNGTYHHRTVNNVETTGKLKDYHLIKFRKCMDKGIQLISIWQDEILYKEDACRSMVHSTLFQQMGQYRIKKITKSVTRAWVLNNFPTMYNVDTQNFGVYADDQLIGVIKGSKNQSRYVFQVFCVFENAYPCIRKFLSEHYSTPMVATNNDHISHQAMLDAGFKLKEIRLDEKIRTVNNHGSYPTYNSGTSIWTI